MILAVIPARGGSKGIPRKNVRLMNGKPLLYYSIQNAKKCALIDDVVVSSDDEEILNIAEMYGAETLNRESHLAQDAVTLDPVIYDAVIRMEKEKNVHYDIVVTLQATSPLLSENTLQRALQDFQQKNFDTYISVVNKPHLSWKMVGEKCVPNYTERLNRQQLPVNFSETGAFLITRRECMRPNSRIGKNVSVFEMPEKEAVDIDTEEDWLICEHELRKKRILLRADGYKELGMGHIYRCLTLAYGLLGHEIMFVTKREHEQGVKKLQESYMPLKLIEHTQDFFDFVQEWKPDVIVNDCLDTEESYIKKLKTMVSRVITIEDLGTGADYADAVINALYENKEKRAHYYSGESYVCLREEFIIAQPAEYKEKLQHVAVIFGGTDPSDFTGRIYKLARRIHKDYPHIKFTFITGSGYDCKAHRIKTLEEENIEVFQNLKQVSNVFSKADFAFTSQGRTVYELAAMGVPAIVLAQNERETKHTFACMENGFLNLGLGNKVSDETIMETFLWILKTPQIRQEMQRLMLRHDLKRGLERVIRIILEED